MPTSTVLIAGAPGAGQNTFIESISDIGLISTRGHAVGAPAVEMGLAHIADDLSVTMLGVVGTGGLDLMREVTAGNLRGIVLLIDRSRVNDYPAASEILYRLRADNVPYIIAVHQRRPTLTPPRPDLTAILGSEAQPTLHDVNLDQPASVRSLLTALLHDD